MLPHILTFIDRGGIHASRVLYHSKSICYREVLMAHISSSGLLEGVLFANIRFHDTVSRGRLLNRFGKDFEGTSRHFANISRLIMRRAGVDSNLPDNFGRSVMYALSAATTVVTVSVVGGWSFVLGIVILGTLYYNGEYHPSFS